MATNSRSYEDEDGQEIQCEMEDAPTITKRINRTRRVGKSADYWLSISSPKKVIKLTTIVFCCLEPSEKLYP